MTMIIDETVQEHQIWLSSGGQEGKRAYFAGENRQNADFSHRKLSRANFRGCDLTGADFSHTDITQADFTDAILDKAIFKATRCSGAIFKHSRAHGLSCVQSDISATNWQGADLSYAYIEASQCARAQFREAVMAESRWQYAACVGVDLRGAQIDKSQWIDSDLSDADLRDCSGRDMLFERMQMIRSFCRNADLSGAQFIETDVSHALDLAPEWRALVKDSAAAKFEQERAQIEQLRAEVERARTSLDSAQHQLTQDQNQIAEMKSEIMAREQALLQAVKACQPYAKRLLMISALWCVITAALATVILYQISIIGVDRLNLVEIAIVVAITLVLLGLHVASARITFKAGRLFERLSLHE